MRLKKSKTAVEEILINHLNEGYKLLSFIDSDYSTRKADKSYDSDIHGKEYEDKLEEWGQLVLVHFDEIFPTELEKNEFLKPPYKFRTVNADWDKKYSNTKVRLEEIIESLKKIIENNIARYTDLPIEKRLYIEDIDSFRNVRDVNPSVVKELLDENGYLDLSEDFIQIALEQILDVSFHKKDWGGEINDLYTANIIVNGSRIAGAFLLKGNGLKKKTMEIRDCGKNGDQLLRLFDSPAQLFIVQYVGNISEAVIKDVDKKVENLKDKGEKAYYCIIDGQDTARILRAYKKR